MLEFLKHITSRTKILILSMFLILMPGAIISYLSMKSIQEKAENQEVKYLGTVNLVRDKLEGELFQLESKFRNSVMDSLLIQEGEAGIQHCLQTAGREYPEFKNLMLLGVNGELFTSTATLGLSQSGQPQNQSHMEFSGALSSAENAEFIEKNHSAAIRAYRKAFLHAASPGEKTLLHARIGRNYYKMHQYEEGIQEYKKILDLEEVSHAIGNVPASIVALHQVAGGYEELNADQELKTTLLELYRQLLEHPWDLSGGEYLFYLKTTSRKIREIESSNAITGAEKDLIVEMRMREDMLLDQAVYMQQVRGEILEELMSNLERMTSSETRHQIFPRESGPAMRLSYFRLPPSIQHAQYKALVFQFDENHLLTELFPRVFSSVELGKDLTAGIFNEHDSLLLIQHHLEPSGYLGTSNFTRYLIPWKVVLFDTEGKSLEQLAGRERRLYLGLFVGIIAVMCMGTLFLIRTVAHETEISRMKSEFVSNVTHELKTPLSLIRMFGETLESGIVTDDEKRQEFYSIITKESERLTHLINNVLDFSRLDSGRKEYEFEETDLVAIIRHSLEAYKFHIRDRGFEIETHLPEEPVRISVDKDAISQAFLNLLSNAVKYSEDKKYIGVEIGRETDSVRISVRDHGIGIPKGELKKIFDKFYRVPNRRVKHTRGSGLGLTLTKHIIEAHGGSIEVVSEPGEGSRFTLRIPVQ